MKHANIVNTGQALGNALAFARLDGNRVSLVPTMGALHDGHLSLVREARLRSDKVVVSIFVNPKQFAPHEDFSSYPRGLESDCAKLDGLADIIFVPSIAEMYPDGFASRLEVSGPARGLESESRPRFFSGVATVVAKLLIAVGPDYAIFGEKDYQQLLVIRRVVADLGLPVEIAGGAIVREPDGLAMSSRNAYLSADERVIAGRLNLVLKDTAMRVAHGDPPNVAEQYGKSALLEAGFDAVDYVAARDAETLGSITGLHRPARLLAAAKIGKTRLIDNMAI